MSEFVPGIHFGMGEDAYHQIPALSSHGIKNLRASPLDFYVRSWMSPDQEEIASDEDTIFKIIGTAYDTRITEGRDRFLACYAPEIDPKDYPDALRTNDALKVALKAADLPVSGNKDVLITRLLEHQPTAQIWDVIKQGYEAKHNGKIFLSEKTLRRIEIAAAMIEKHPQLCKAFTGGVAQVVIMWEVTVTLEDQSTVTVPMKARLDYLKPRAIVDLKTFGNPHGKPIAQAVNVALANYRYHVQAAVYQEAVATVPEHIRAGRVFGDCARDMLRALAEGHEKTFLFVWQCSGPAPVAIGRTLPMTSGIFQIGKLEIEHHRATFARCMKAYGDDPWVEASDIEAFCDDEIPSYAAV